MGAAGRSKTIPRRRRTRRGPRGPSTRGATSRRRPSRVSSRARDEVERVAHADDERDVAGRVLRGGVEGDVERAVPFCSTRAGFVAPVGRRGRLLDDRDRVDRRLRLDARSRSKVFRRPPSRTERHRRARPARPPPGPRRSARRPRVKRASLAAHRRPPRRGASEPAIPARTSCRARDIAHCLTFGVATRGQERGWGPGLAVTPQVTP